MGSKIDPQKALLTKSDYMIVEDLPDQPIELKTGNVTIHARITQLKFSDSSAKQSFDSLTVTFEAQR